MVEDTIQGAVDALRVEREQLDKAITALERTSSVKLSGSVGQA